MPAAHETAYPRPKATVTATDLGEVYTPTAEEFALAMNASARRGARLGFLVLLKTFQRLGYFALAGDVPEPIVRHIAWCLGVDARPDDLHRYDRSGTRRRHIAVIRAFLEVRPFDAAARGLVEAVVREAAWTKDDLVDLINVAIEELVRHRFELPGFSILLREARRGRAEVHRALYRRVARALGDEGRDRLDGVLIADDAHPAPLDAIRLSGGRFYCPRGACRQEAERLIREARGRLTAAAVADR